MKFLFLPHLELSDVASRIDIFGIYEPVVNQLTSNVSVGLATAWQGSSCSSCNYDSLEELLVSEQGWVFVY
jgi:hypothetical protein